MFVLTSPSWVPLIKQKTQMLVLHLQSHDLVALSDGTSPQIMQSDIFLFIAFKIQMQDVKLFRGKQNNKPGCVWISFIEPHLTRV